jgi:hypothetical protein
VSLPATPTGRLKRWSIYWQGSNAYLSLSGFRDHTRAQHPPNPNTSGKRISCRRLHANSTTTVEITRRDAASAYLSSFLGAPGGLSLENTSAVKTAPIKSVVIMAMVYSPIYASNAGGAVTEIAAKASKAGLRLYVAGLSSEFMFWNASRAAVAFHSSNPPAAGPGSSNETDGRAVFFPSSAISASMRPIFSS